MGVPTIHQALMNCEKFETTNLQSVRWFYNGGALSRRVDEGIYR